MNKPFNLGAFKAGDVALSIAGREFRFVGPVPDGSGDIVVLGESGGLSRRSWGGVSLHHSNGGDSLVSMKPKTKVVWLNIYPHDGNIEYRAASHDSEIDADGRRGSHALNEKPIRIEIRV